MHINTTNTVETTVIDLSKMPKNLYFKLLGLIAVTVEYLYYVTRPPRCLATMLQKRLAKNGTRALETCVSKFRPNLRCARWRDTKAGKYTRK
jgi:hypothetical protein